MDGEELVDGFELDQDFVFDDEVGAETTIEGEVFVADGDFFLRGYRKTSIGEFECEALFINRFEQSRPKFPVHRDGRANDGVRQGVVFKLLRVLRVLRG